MFDRLAWYEVVAYLLPLVAVMWMIRQREIAAISTSFKELTDAQKGWVLLMLLPPGTSSRILSEMTPDMRDGYIQAGVTVKGSGRNLIKPLLHQAVRSLPDEQKKQAGSNVEENLGRLARWADTEPTQFLGWLRRTWPQTQAPATSPQLVSSPT